MKTTERSRTTTEASTGPRREKEALSQVVGMLHELQDAVEEIRAQLAGTSKSHFTVDEVAEMTGRAPYTVRTWIKQKQIKAERVAGTGPRGRLLIPRDELKKLITRGQGENVPAVLAK